LCFLVIACLFFCSYGDWKTVYIESAEFLSASPSFLALNKNKSIRVSTIKNKLADWSNKVDEQRRGWTPSSEFDSCMIHAPWIQLVIKLQKAKKASKVILFISILDTLLPQCAASTHEQDMQSRHSARARSTANVRNDSMISQAVVVPPAHQLPPQPQRAPVAAAANVDASRVGAVQSAAANFRQVVGAAHPAAINPNNIQIFSGSGGSHNSRKRMLAFARGEELPTAKRPEVQGLIDNFGAQVQHHLTGQHLQGQAAMVTAASG
jgi:hypothetical protein